MDPIPSDRVNDNTPQKGRKGKLRPRRSLAEPLTSSPSRPKVSTKKRKREKESLSSDYYSVKSILEERRENGRTLYLIDWEDNTETGEPYDKSWEPEENITAAAIADWQNQKGEGRLQSPKYLSHSVNESPSENRSKRPVKRARKQRANISSPSSPASKKPRRVGTAETARFQSVSQEERLEVLQEIKDSYEEDSSNQASSGLQEQLPTAEPTAEPPAEPTAHPEAQQLQVLVPPIDQVIDRSEYRKLSIQSSQPSQPSEPSESSNPSQPSQRLPDSYSEQYSSQPFSSNSTAQNLFKTPQRHHKFIWDEDSAPVIPDSQALPGSSSYQSTETPTSRTETSTRPNTGVSEVTNLESLVQDAQPRPSWLSPESSDIDRSHTVPLSSHPRELLEEESSSSQREGLVAASTVEHESGSALDTVPVTEDSLNSTSEEEPAFTGTVAVVEYESGSTVDNVPATEDSLKSTFEEEPAFTGTVATVVTEDTDNLQASPSPEPDFSQFQTQLPLPFSSVEAVKEPDLTDSHVTTTQSLSDPIAEPELRESASIPPAEPAGSSLGLILQDAQVASPDADRVSRPNNEITTSEDLQDILPRRISPVASTQVSENPAPSQGDVDIVRTQDHDTPDDSASEQVQKDSSDYIIESIENKGESSSPIPPRPSPPLVELEDLQDTHDTPRRGTPQRVDKMENQVTSSEKNIMEILREARAKAAAETMARQAARREAEGREASASASASASISASASEVPPSPPPIVNQMLPLRDPILDLHVPISEPALSPRPSAAASSQALRDAQWSPLGPMEYAVPLPMVSYIRDIYDTELNNNRPYIQSLDSKTIDEEEYSALNLMIENMKMLCDHNGLLTESHATQDSMTDAVTTKYAENTSTKCQFLAGLLQKLRPHDTHIVVFVREGRMRMILEAMCRNYEVNYSGSEPSFTQGQPKYLLRVTFISTTQTKSDISIDPVSLAIAFDSTYVDNSFTRSVRSFPNLDELAPLVYLVVTHSAEHLEMCLEDEYDAHSRIHWLVNGVWDLRKQLGILEPHTYPDGEVAGKAVAEYVLNTDPDKAWPLLPLPDLEGIYIEVEGSPVPQVHPLNSGSTTQSRNTSTPSPQTGQSQKRSLATDDSGEFSKRQRLTPNPTSLNTDSVKENSHFMDRDLHKSNDSSATETLHSQTGVDKGDKRDELSILNRKIAILEEEKEDLNRRLQDQAQRNEAAEAELKQHNQRLEAQCEDLEKSIQTIQPKYQEALNEQGSSQHELAEVSSTMNNLRQKLEARVLDVNKLREEKATLTADLVAARLALASSEVPEIADINQLKDDLATARGEIDRLQKRITNMNSEMEYMRGHYQTASSAAADAQSEIGTLRDDNAVLKRKASSNAREIHVIQASEEIKQHLHRIAALEASKAELTKELEKKSEELNALKNGRRSTRGTSVPRSPRMGTMSPGVRERPLSRVFGSGVGSRGTSPAPGEPSVHRGPFGDALYPDKGPARFGNHLSYER